jgi:hypothetical protein
LDAAVIEVSRRSASGMLSDIPHPEKERKDNFCRAATRGIAAKSRETWRAEEQRLEPRIGVSFMGDLYYCSLAVVLL